MQPQLLQRFVFSVLLVCLAAGCKQDKVQSVSGPPPVPVVISTAAQDTVPLEVRVVGTAEASAKIELKSQVAGELLRVHFTEGQNVAKGALLFEIDSRPFRETLRQAEASLARDRAQLRQAEAALARDSAQSRNAEVDATRYAELLKAGVISRSQHDQVRTSADVYRESVRASQASIEGARAAIESDLAAIERAKLDIGYSAIRSPISGRTGNLLVHTGNLVKANDVPLVVIHQVSPIWVSFNVPEQHLSKIRALAARQKLSVRVSPQDSPDRAAQGLVTLVDNAVDTSTGTIRLKATLPNADGMLWPGQFVNIVLTLDTMSGVTVVPAEAVQSGQQGQFVYVVKKDNTVEPRPVQAGRTVANRTVIESGVQPGETVVTDGHLRLFPGAPVKPVSPVRAGSSAQGSRQP